MKPKYLHIVNWEKYQARLDKDLPWVKLWGSFFDRPWFRDLADENKIIPVIFFDVCRRFNNKMPSKSAWYTQIYGLKHTEYEFLNVCKVLRDNDFLSDVPSDVLNKIRSDKKDTSDNTANNLDLFDTFWASYPRKVAKEAAIKAFKKLSLKDGLFERIMEGLEKAKASGEWQKDNGQYIPHPATFLNGKRWLDDWSKGIETPKPRTTLVR